MVVNSGVTGSFEIKNLRIRPDAFNDIFPGIRVIDGFYPDSLFITLLRCHWELKNISKLDRINEQTNFCCA